MVTRRRTFNILFFIRRNRLNSEGLAPIYTRITINREAVEFFTTIYIDPALWSQPAKRATGRSRRAGDINHSLMLIRSRIQTLYYKLMDKEGNVRADKLRDVFFGRTCINPSTSLLSLFDKLTGQKEKLAAAGVITRSTLGSYRCTRRKVTGFLKKNYLQDIDISGVDYEFINNFEIYLLSSGKCSHNTMVRHMRQLKQVVTAAFRNKHIRENPFYNKKLGIRKTRRPYLTEEELSRIMAAKFENKILEEVRDIFVFSCFTGLSHADQKKLSHSHIADGCITIDRTKTGNSCFIPLLTHAKNIIAKYNNSKQRPKFTGKVFPVRASQRTNRYLKEIAGICGIKKNLTTHLARHRIFS